jgi:hypothetical protein
MTATFNTTLLSYLQQITGFDIPNPSLFWSSSKSFSRHNIDISISLSNFKMKAIKESLTCTLNDNIDKKSILYCNVAKSVTTIGDSLDNWLNEADNKIKGDTLLINGDLESEWKFFSSQKFTETSLKNCSMINNETYFPRILIATSGCIGAGLDLSNVHLVVRDDHLLFFVCF